MSTKKGKAKPMQVPKEFADAFVKAVIGPKPTDEEWSEGGGFYESCIHFVDDRDDDCTVDCEKDALEPSDHYDDAVQCPDSCKHFLRRGG